MDSAPDGAAVVSPHPGLISLLEYSTSDAAILGRVIQPDKPTLPAQASRAILALDFTDSDKDQMRQLPAKARQGMLRPEEQIAVDNYERVGHLLNVMQSKARCSLKQRGNGKPH